MAQFYPNIQDETSGRMRRVYFVKDAVKNGERNKNSSQVRRKKPHCTRFLVNSVHKDHREEIFFIKLKPGIKAIFQHLSRSCHFTFQSIEQLVVGTEFIGHVNLKKCKRRGKNKRSFLYLVLF